MAWPALCLVIYRHMSGDRAKMKTSSSENPSSQSTAQRQGSNSSLSAAVGGSSLESAAESAAESSLESAAELDGDLIAPLTEPFIVTIDGPAASGKSSVSREVARRMGWCWVSTGAFYRGDRKSVV